MIQLTEIRRRADLGLMGAALFLAGVGICLVYSTGQGPLAAARASLYLKQLMWLGGGIAAMAAAAALPLRFYDGLAKLLYALSLLALAAVLVIGEVRYGARRWLDLGGFLLQPSEFAKVATILLLARILSDRRTDWTRFRSLTLPLIIALVPTALVFEEPDLGTALSLVFVLFGMLYWAGVPALTLAVLVLPLASMLCSFWWWVWLIFFGLQWAVLHYSGLPVVHYVFVMLGNGVIGAVSNKVWNSLEDYQKERIISFLGSGVDRLGAGYQSVQSKIAIGSGSIVGTGYLKGTQKSLAFLPQQHTDFIFAVLGEEFGFLGCVVVVALYAFIIWKGISIALRSRSRFAGLVCAGVASLLLYHVGLNILMTLGLAPVTGVPLPFLSYGGSSLITCLALVGIMAGISVRVHEF
ncbi:MAG: rod shape-determining protein RodA [Candidatus Eisenbacteria bacterium]|nr:rod shape-determining protein RodA [Candidatus Eisenbacteria bacterium]